MTVTKQFKQGEEGGRGEVGGKAEDLEEGGK